MKNLVIIDFAVVNSGWSPEFPLIFDHLQLTQKKRLKFFKDIFKVNKVKI